MKEKFVYIVDTQTRKLKDSSIILMHFQQAGLANIDAVVYLKMPNSKQNITYIFKGNT